MIQTGGEIKETYDGSMSTKGKHKGEVKVGKRKTDQKVIMKSELERAPKSE